MPALVVVPFVVQQSKRELILADNLGWGELGCYGGGELRGAPTPHTDALAGEGPFTVFAPTDDAFAKLPEVKPEEIDKESWTLLIPEVAEKYPLE